MTPNFNIAYVILAILIAPIFEEFLCRGYVYDSKIGKLSPFVGITLSTFVFMAMHMTIYHLVVGFFLGIYLGYLRYRTDNLRLPILTHMTINILSLVIMYNYSYFIKFYQYFDVISICLLPFIVLVIYFKLNLEFFKQLKK
jgi:membrane protease YdiL (CAAX protease family)